MNEIIIRKVYEDTNTKNKFTKDNINRIIFIEKFLNKDSEITNKFLNEAEITNLNSRLSQQYLRINELHNRISTSKPNIVADCSKRNSNDSKLKLKFETNFNSFQTQKNLKLGIEQQKTKENLILSSNSNDTVIANFKFSLWEHIQILLCTFCFGKIRKKQVANFLNLLRFSMNYFDIVKIVKKLHEYEKLKYILLANKQLSLFNKILKPSNPLIKENDLINIMAERLQFDHNEESQNKFIDQIFENKDHFFLIK